MRLFDYLSKWLANGTGGQRAARRPACAPFAGHIELLEPRTVLSAATGGAHFAPVAIEPAARDWTPEHRIAVAQDFGDHVQAGGAPRIASRMDSEFARPNGDASHWMPNGYDPSRVGPPRLATDETMPPPPPTPLNGPMGPLSLGARPVATIVVEVRFQRPVKQDFALNTTTEIASGRDPDDFSTPQRIQAGGAVGEPVNSNVLPDAESVPSRPNLSTAAAQSVAPTSKPNALDAAAELPGLFTSLTEIDGISRPATSGVLAAHDTAFQEYPSRQLLLSAVANPIDDTDSTTGAEEDDGQVLLDDDAAEVEDIVAQYLRDDVQESLDTVQRERAAIDRVLATLRSPSRTAPEHDRAASHARRPEDGGESSSAAHQGSARQARGSDVSIPAGGMILLAATGDANRGAYDLAAVLAKGAERVPEVAGGAEAVVGVYQAFDVSGPARRPTESRPATRHDSAILGEIASTDREPGA